MGKSAKIKIGDTVVIKDRIMCPDMESLSIAGWQGRVLDVFDGDDEGILIYIEWDSITLRSMPEYFIRQSEDEGLGWTSMNLSIDEVKPIQPRDTEKDVKSAIKELSALHSWDYLGEEGPRIGNVLKGIDPDNSYACLKAWDKYLRKVLVFPFDARIAEGDEGLLKIGDRVRVHKINIIDDLYGVMVDVTSGRHNYVYPLCDLEALDKKSSNYQNVHDYVVWFANV